MACSFQGVSLCYSFFCLLVSSVSGFHPDTKGTVEDIFFFLIQAHLFSRAVGREGGMLQTDNTGVSSQCLSHTGSAPAHGACSLPAHTAQALGCPARNYPWPPASPRSKLLRFRHSGSPQKLRFSCACVLCPSQVQAAQVMRCLASAIAATYRLPAARLSRCTTGAPSQADVDRPDPQEVLVSKEACLKFCR